MSPRALAAAALRWRAAGRAAAVLEVVAATGSAPRTAGTRMLAAAAPAGAFCVVLTHSHDLDLAIATEIIKRADFGFFGFSGFFGLVGSRTKRARFEHRLRERGIAPELLARMSCPIGVAGVAGIAGIAGIEGKEPEVIAMAVVAQLLQRRR